MIAIMFSLSKDSEKELKTGILNLIQGFLQSYFKPKQRILGLIIKEELQEELSISSNTLARWEKAGLKRYMPPVEGTRLIYYKISDLLVFLGADDD